jgi:hypothetical protein
MKIPDQKFQIILTRINIQWRFLKKNVLLINKMECFSQEGEAPASPNGVLEERRPLAGLVPRPPTGSSAADRG